MTPLGNLTVRRKVLAISMISSAAALFLAGTVLIVYDFVNARDTLREEVSVLAQVIGERSTAALSFEDQATATANLDALGALHAVVAACLYTAEGAVFAAYSREDADRPCPPEVPPDGSHFAAGSLHVVAPVELDRERIGSAYLRAGLGDVRSRARRYTGLVMLVVLIAAAVAFFFSSRLLRIVSGPIEQLVATARKISRDKDYSTRARKMSDDELGVLVDAFNQMLAIVEEQNRELLGAKDDLEDLVDELAGKNEELERFTYTVSHDLKSPLLTIKGFLGYLEQDALSGRHDRMKQDMQHISRAAEKMERLLADLLELSRIGRVVNEPQETSVSDIAAEAVELVSGQISARRVVVEVAPGLPVVRGDRPRLVEVFQNLIDNAVKFMGDEPEPRVEIGRDAVDGRDFYYVRDNGIGIDPRFKDKVFGLFERLSVDVEGTGIGLATVRRIIEHHGGEIWFESDGPGRGTAFCFTLPARNGHERRAEGAPHHDHDRRATPGSEHREVDISCQEHSLPPD